MNRDLTGFIQPAVNWYEDAPINALMTPGSLIPTALNVPQIISTPDLCGTIYQFAPPQVSQRSAEAGAVILSMQANSSALTPEQQYLMRKYVHRKLRQNPQWLTLGTPQDTLYQNFYQQTDSANFGRFRTIEENAELDNQPTVQSGNTAVSSNNAMDHNLKLVTEIYARTWLLGQFEFSPADSATLYAIAILNPCIDGSGVYAARAMLGLMVDDATGNSGYRSENPEPEQVFVSAIYPNPAKETVTIDLNAGEQETGELEILDLNGRLVQKQFIAAGTKSAVMDVSMADAGVYLVRFTVNGEVRLNEKLVILK